MRNKNRFVFLCCCRLFMCHPFIIIKQHLLVLLHVQKKTFTYSQLTIKYKTNCCDFFGSVYFTIPHSTLSLSVSCVCISICLWHGSQHIKMTIEAAAFLQTTEASDSAIWNGILCVRSSVLTAIKTLTQRMQRENRNNSHPFLLHRLLCWY